MVGCYNTRQQAALNFWSPSPTGLPSIARHDAAALFTLSNFSKLQPSFDSCISVEELPSSLPATAAQVLKARRSELMSVWVPALSKQDF